MATNKTTVSVYADGDLLAALNEFKDSGNYKSLNVAIVAILRGKLFGDTSDNIQSTLDVESIVNDSVTSAIAPLLARLESLENTRSEATAPAKKAPDAIPESKGDSNPEITGNRLEPEPLPIFEAIENIAAPMIEKSLPDKALSDAIVATDKEKAYTLVQVNKSQALAKLEELGLLGDPKSGKDFAAMFPDYFEYDTKNTKLSYKKPKTQS